MINIADINNCRQNIKHNNVYDESYFSFHKARSWLKWIKEWGGSRMALFGLVKKSGKSDKTVKTLKSRGTGDIDIQDARLIAKMKMIDLSKSDLDVIKSIQPLIEKNIDLLVTTFYDTILDLDHLKEMVQKHSTVERLKKTLRRHMIELFDGNIDKNFINKRLKVANIHFKIGLEPSWYMGAFQNIQNSLKRTNGKGLS